MFVYILLVLLIFVFIIILSLVVDYQDKKRISQKIEKFESYVAVLDFHLQKAYDIIYKDRMLIYSLEATKIDDKEFDIVSKDFCYLVFKILGPSLQNEFIELYGNEETLIFNILEYFNTKVENDQIREKAKQNLLNDSKIFNNEEEKKLF